MSEQSIYDKSVVIRNETQEYANTRGRVADVLDDINLTKANKTDVNNAIQIVLDELGITETELYAYIDNQNIDINKKVNKPTETSGEIYYILSNIDGVITWNKMSVSDGFLPKFNGNSYENSVIFQDSTGKIGIGNINPLHKLDVNGEIKADALYLPANNDSATANRFRSDGTYLYYADENSVEQKLQYVGDIGDRIITVGNVTADSTKAYLPLHPSGKNEVIINGDNYFRTIAQQFPFTPVVAGQKILIIETQPDAEVFHLVEGLEAPEAVEPAYTGLFVARLVVSTTGVVVERENTIYATKVKLNQEIENREIEDAKKADNNASNIDPYLHIWRQKIDANYVHDQAVPKSIWTINHPLNKKVSITITDTAGTVVEGRVTINDGNQVIIEFNSPFSGEAVLN